MPGKKYNSLKGGKRTIHQYRGLRKHGFSKQSAAAISNWAANRRKAKAARKAR